MTDIETLIIEEADKRDLTYAKDFNGRAYALMNVEWIGYFDTLDEVLDFLGISVETDKTDSEEYVELVIKIPEKTANEIKDNAMFAGCISSEILWDVTGAIVNATPLPKGHGDIFDKAEILRFLKCPEYETCDWRNCSDCNRSRCINLNNVNDLVPIIEVDKEEEQYENNSQ